MTPSDDTEWWPPMNLMVQPAVHARQLGGWGDQEQVHDSRLGRPCWAAPGPLKTRWKTRGSSRWFTFFTGFLRHFYHDRIQWGWWWYDGCRGTDITTDYYGLLRTTTIFSWSTMFMILLWRCCKQWVYGEDRTSWDLPWERDWVLLQMMAKGHFQKFAALPQTGIFEMVCLKIAIESSKQAFEVGKGW